MKNITFSVLDNKYRIRRWKYIQGPHDGDAKWNYIMFSVFILLLISAEKFSPQFNVSHTFFFSICYSYLGHASCVVL